MRFRIIAALVLSSGRTLLAASETLSREDALDQATFKAVCGSCHATSLVDGLRTESEWLEEIEHMVKIGARGTDDQFDRVMRVLRRTLTKVNVNTASASEIAPVLDISEATAQQIVKRRTADGGFKTLDELKKVRGVDPAKIDARKNRILF